MIELESNECYEDLDIQPIPFQIYTKPVSYDNVFRNNLEKNCPCLFGPWLVNEWTSTKNWVTKDGIPNCQYLSKEFGDAEIPVADCNKKYYDAQEKTTHIFKNYLSYYEQRQLGNSEECLYLKDWHFVRDFPEYEAYTTPQYFASDWLNEYYREVANLQDDYRFAYMGPKGSWTPFHADVFRSFSWSANICGRKRWIFYPPSDSSLLRNKFGDLPYDVNSAEFKDRTHFPSAHLTSGPIEIIQEKGDTIFVPSNWFHQVWNLEDTLSINHNWINGSNIGFVLEFFIDSLKEVEKAIEDCKEMEGWVAQCQLVLKATHGMTLRDFYRFLETIALRRIDFLKGRGMARSFPEWTPGKNHVVYDVRKLHQALTRLLDELSSDVLEYLEEKEAPSLLIDELCSVI